MRIIRVKSYNKFVPLLDDLARIHCEVFAKEPWNFSITRKESVSFLRGHFAIDERIFVVGFDGKKPIGAALASPLIAHFDLASLVDPDVVDNGIYLTRIFIDEEYQGKGFGRALHEARLQFAKDDGYKFALHRTVPTSRMYSLVMKDGFEKVCSMPVVERHVTELGTPFFQHKPRVVSLKKL